MVIVVGINIRESGGSSSRGKMFIVNVYSDSDNIFIEFVYTAF